MTSGSKIENVDELGESPARKTALACLDAGIHAAHPRTVIRASIGVDDDTLTILESTYQLTAFDDIVVLGGGKAAGQVAATLETLLGDRLTRGVVVTNDPVETSSVRVREGDHPIPSDRGVDGAAQVLDLASSAGETTLVLAILTGGGSALLPAPADGITLDDLQTVTDALLASGADIHEINAVRKHCSEIKGGGLAAAAAPARVVGLAFSDVVGDDLDVIASGPTAPDSSTFADALAVLEAYDVDAPTTIRDRLKRGIAGEIAETPGPDDDRFDRVDNHVLATNFTAVDAARQEARERGYEELLLSTRIRGDARDAALSHIAIAEECLASGNPIEPPAVVISGGETTVNVTGDGRGGPNQEFALAAGLELPDGSVLAAVDTDGADGATDAAGALVDSETVDDPAAARAALEENNVHPYLEDRDALVMTGRTGTNVNDLRVLVIDESEAVSSAD